MDLDNITVHICKTKTRAIHPHIIAKTIYKREIDKNVPYYEIEYYDITGGTWYEGYGSTDLELVQKWLHEYFEVIEEDIVPVIHAHWITDRDKYYKLCYNRGQTYEKTEYLTEDDVACSNCLKKYNMNDYGFIGSCDSYCPNCGAKMLNV